MSLIELKSKITRNKFWTVKTGTDYYMWTEKDPKPFQVTREYAIKRISSELRELDTVIISRYFK